MTQTSAKMQKHPYDCSLYQPTRCYRPAKLTYKQAVIYRQENFPRHRMYQIFTPKLSAELQDTSRRAFNIASIPLKQNLMVSNLPMYERARMQCYNIKCTRDDYTKMVNAPKYIFDTYHFNYESNHNRIYSKTFYYCIAPTLDDDSIRQLPILYRLGISRELGNPEHYSFSIYAVVGGYADGFYFLARMDNDTETHAHKKKIPQAKSNKKLKPAHIENFGKNTYVSKKVPFPHIHRPHFNAESCDLRENSEPKHIPQLVSSNFDKRLQAFLDIFNISPEMLLVQDNCKVVDVLETAKTFHHYHGNVNQESHREMSKYDRLDFLKYEYCSDFGQNDRFIDNVNQRVGSPYLRH